MNGLWTFVHKNISVSGICDMVINSGLPEEKELWKWLEKQKEQPKAEHHFWIMHSALFIERPEEDNRDITKPEEYLKWYFSIDLPGRAASIKIVHYQVTLTCAFKVTIDKRNPPCLAVIPRPHKKYQ
jgi:hypothetical protein